MVYSMLSYVEIKKLRIRRRGEEGEKRAASHVNANSFVFASLNSLKLLLPRYECYDNKGKKEQDRIVEINDDVFFFFSRMVYPRLNNRYLARESKLIARPYLAIATIHRDSAAI